MAKGADSRSRYFNEGKPCYTKEETASAGCKLALSKLAVFSGDCETPYQTPNARCI